MWALGITSEAKRLKKFHQSPMGSCQNRKNGETLDTYNSKTRVHKLMKLGTLRDGNKVYSMVE